MPAYPSEPIATQYPWVKEGPFGWAALAISQSQVAGKLNVNDATTGSNLNTGVPAPYAGTIVGIVGVLDTNKTAGVLQVSPTINTTEVASTNSLYRVAMGNAIQTVQKLSDAVTGLRFTAGQLLGVKITTDGSFAPTAHDFLCWLIVVYDYVTP